MMTDIQLNTARRRLVLGISNVGVWVLASIAGIALVATEVASPRTTGDLFKVMGWVLAIQSLFDAVGGTLLMPDPSAASRRFLPLWLRGVTTHSLLLFSMGALSYWSFVLSGGFGLSILISSLALVLFRRHILLLVSNARIRPLKLEDRSCWGVDSADPSFTGGISGLARGAQPLLPASWKTRLTKEQIQAVIQRRLWEVSNHLPARSFLFTLLWNLAGSVIGSLVLQLHGRMAEPAILLQSCWMTLWAFVGLLLLPSLSRSAVLSADQALAAKGLDAAGWIRRFPQITGEDGNAKTLNQRIFYPIPSAAERLSHLAAPTQAPIFGNVARANLFLSLATLTILGRCVHCNVGRPELWIFPPSD